MARAALKWSLTDLAEASAIGRATVARFELGDSVSAQSIASMAQAFERKRVRFVTSGNLAGAVYMIRAGQN